MHEPLDESALAEFLPGTWVVAATNFPMWLSGQRREPRLTYGLVSASPLVLTDDVAYLTPEGAQKHIRGKDAHRGDAAFRWRGKGLLTPLSSQWSIEGTNEDKTVLAIRFSKSLLSPAGVDILVRDGSHHPELRALVARSTERLGITLEDFASLTWLAGSTSD